MRVVHEVWPVGALLIGLTVAAAGGAEAQLRGDAEAVAAVERMIEAVGGRELWTESRTLELDYRARAKGVDGVVVERAWRDLTRAEQRIEIERAGNDLVVVLTETAGWRARGDSVTAMPHDAVAQHRLFWPKDYYTLIRRFAVEDPDLWVEYVEDRARVVVFSETHGELGWWEVASDGAIERWGTVNMGEPLEYVYGPMRDFGGGLRFPAWGASLDGGWRFEYTRAVLSPEAMDRSLLARPVGG